MLNGMPASGPAVLVVHAVVTGTYAGFQVLVTAVVYRMFPLVPAPAFPEYARAHQRRIGYVVAPLFAALVASAGSLLVLRPAAAPLPALVASATLTASLLVVTAVGAVPRHAELADGFRPESYTRLLRVDLVRCALAGVNAVLALLLALRAL